MADITEEPLDAPLTNPVPQATGGSLPGQAAAAAGALGGIAAPPSAEQALLQANFGDDGAAAYQNLRAAGRTAPAPSAAPAAEPTAGDKAGDVVTGLGNLIGNTLVGGLTQNPNLVQQQEALTLQRQQQKQLLAQKDAVDTLDFMNKMRAQNLDPSVRVRLIAQNAAAHGRQLSPAEAEYIDHAASSDSFAHLLERIKAGGPDGQEAMATFGMLYSGDPVKMVTANDQIRQESAKSDKMIADAAAAAGKALNGPEVKTEYQGAQAQATAELTESLGRKPTPAEVAKRASEIRTQETAKKAADRAAGVNAENINSKPLTDAEIKSRDDIKTTWNLLSQLKKEITDLGQAASGGPISGRAAQAAYKAGIDTRLAKLNALSELIKVQGIRAFISGRPAIEYIHQIQQHMPNTYDQFKLKMDKITGVMEPFLREKWTQLQKGLTTSRQGVAQEPLDEAPAPARGPKRISASDFLNAGTPAATTTTTITPTEESTTTTTTPGIDLDPMAPNLAP